MKNKTKPAKAKPAAAPVRTVPGQWLYLNEREVTVSDLALAVRREFEDVEVWKEASVLEIVLGEKSSMDMEQTEAVMDDDFSNAFLQTEKAAVLYLVTIRPEDYGTAEKAMKQILAVCGGLFCGDTEDFTPQIR